VSKRKKRFLLGRAFTFEQEGAEPSNKKAQSLDRKVMVLGVGKRE
jgi:hypothetical protein